MIDTTINLHEQLSSLSTFLGVQIAVLEEDPKSSAELLAKLRQAKAQADRDLAALSDAET